jgi:replicative DNA helicase
MKRRHFLQAVVATPLALTIAPVVEAATRPLEVQDPVTSFPTGIGPMDEIMGGLRPGELWCHSAQPRGGKTLFALNWARHLMLRGYTDTLYQSLDNNFSVIVQRMNDMEAEAPGYRDCGRHLYFSNEPTMAGLNAQVKHIRRGFVVIDTPELMTIQTEHRWQRMGKLVREAKKLALENDVAVLFLTTTPKHVQRWEFEAERTADVCTFSQNINGKMLLFANPKNRSEVPFDLVLAEIHKGGLLKVSG